VFWFDKIRMYQGYQEFKPNNERNRGMILRSPAFVRFKASKEAEIKAWESKRVSVNQDSRLYNRRTTTMEDAKTTDTLRTMEVSWQHIALTQYIGYKRNMYQHVYTQVAEYIIMRTSTMYMVSKVSLLRGIDVRGVRSSQIMLHMMDGIGPAPATAIAMILTTGKTINSLAHDENTVGFLRNKDRNICAVGALASYMVYKEDLAVCVFMLGYVMSSSSTVATYFVVLPYFIVETYMYVFNSVPYLCSPFTRCLLPI
jgi:hypothetical protein